MTGSSYCPTSSLVRLNSIFGIEGGLRVFACSSNITELEGWYPQQHSSYFMKQYILQVPSLDHLYTWKLVTAWKAVIKRSYHHGGCN